MASRQGKLLFESIFSNTDQSRALQTLSDGIGAVLDHVTALIPEVRYLIAGGFHARADLILSIANEELGKAHLLLDAARLDVKRHEARLLELCTGFYDHLTKYAYMTVWRFGRSGFQDFTSIADRFDSAKEPLSRGSTDPEMGEIDIPHPTYFSRDQQMYVDFSDYGWIVPDPAQSFFGYGEDEHFRGMEPTQVADGHLAAWSKLRDADAVSAAALGALNATWREHPVSRNMRTTEIVRLQNKTAEAVAKVSGARATDLLKSPLCFWPCYGFLCKSLSA